MHAAMGTHTHTYTHTVQLILTAGRDITQELSEEVDMGSHKTMAAHTDIALCW